LESLEERLAAWLDRFDVIEEEAAPVVRRFCAVSRLLTGGWRS
jgi:hypothetical protein